MGEENPKPKIDVDPLALQKAAAIHEVDVRTLRKRIAGGRVRGAAGVRADRAIAALQAVSSNP